MTDDEFQRAVKALLDRLIVSDEIREIGVRHAMNLPHTTETLSEIERGILHQQSELRGENN